MNFIHSIKFRITALYLMVLAALLITMSCGIYFSLSWLLYRNLDDSLKLRAKQLTDFRNIIGIIASGTFEEAEGENISFFFKDHGRLRDISSKGQKVNIDKEPVEKALNGESFFLSMRGPKGEKLRIFVSNYVPDQNEIINEPRPEEKRDHDGRGPERPPRRPEVFPEIKSTALVIARQTNDIESTLAILKKILLAAVPLTLAFSGLGGVYLSIRALRPVEAIADTADRIGASDLKKRIEVRTKDELGHLAMTLNRMIERLDKAFERQKQFTSDASHELRAPLAIIQAEASLCLQKERKPEDYQKSLEIIALEAEQMTLLINQLLMLARGDSGKDTVKFDKICITEFVNEICSDVEILCNEKDIRLVCETDGTLFVMGDSKSLRRLMLNLLENAMKYTASGGTILVSAEKERNVAVISVSDTGMGIPEEDLPYIFERFYRVDKARTRDRSGSGLGLSICRQIAHMHEASLDVDSSLNKGTVFYLRLPLLMEEEA